MGLESDHIAIISNSQAVDSGQLIKGKARKQWVWSKSLPRITEVMLAYSASWWGNREHKGKQYSRCSHVISLSHDHDLITDWAINRNAFSCVSWCISIEHKWWIEYLLKTFYLARWSIDASTHRRRDYSEEAWKRYHAYQKVTTFLQHTILFSIFFTKYELINTSFLFSERWGKLHEVETPHIISLILLMINVSMNFPHFR